MISGLDHVRRSRADIEAAPRLIRRCFAQAPSWKNSGDGAARAAVHASEYHAGVDGARRRERGPRRHIRGVIEQTGEGLASICFRTPDITRMHRRLERLALRPEPVAEVEAATQMTGATLSWKRTRAATDTTRGVRMFFLELAAGASALGRHGR